MVVVVLADDVESRQKGGLLLLEAPLLVLPVRNSGSGRRSEVAHLRDAIRDVGLRRDRGVDRHGHSRERLVRAGGGSCSKPSVKI